MKKFLVICLVCLATHAWGQNPTFSQYYTTGLYLNPALSGMEKDVFFGVNYRSQWSNINLPFSTFQFSCIHPVIKQGVAIKQLGSIGGSVFSDKAGPNNEFVTNGLSLAGAYNFYLDKSGNNIISAALQAGIQQKKLNLGALQWSSQYGDGSYDPTRPSEAGVQDRITYPQINAGVLWNHVPKRSIGLVRGIYNGFSISNFNRPKGFFNDRRDAPERLYRVHGAVVLQYRDDLSFSPHYLIEVQQRAQINFGINTTYRLPASSFMSQKDLRVSAGLWYRVQNAFIATLGVGNPSWSAGFSYDANSSSFARNFNGANAYEISLSYRISLYKGYKNFSSPLM